MIFQVSPQKQDFAATLKGPNTTELEVYYAHLNETLLWQLPTSTTSNDQGQSNSAPPLLSSSFTHHRNIFLQNHPVARSFTDSQSSEFIRQRYEQWKTEMAKQEGSNPGTGRCSESHEKAYLKIKLHRTLDYQREKRWGGAAWADRDDSQDIYIM